jgi:hypothetical protein
MPYRILAKRDEQFLCFLKDNDDYIERKEKKQLEVFKGSIEALYKHFWNIDLTVKEVN